MNTHPLISRNKREGGYLGRYKCADDNDLSNIDGDYFGVLPRHHRKGNSPWETLKQRAILKGFFDADWHDASFGKTHY